MNKIDVKNKIKDCIYSHVKDLTTEINGILCDAGMWYGRKEFGKSIVNELDPDDRNADRLMNYLLNDIDINLSGNLQTCKELGMEVK